MGKKKEKSLFDEEFDVPLDIFTKRLKNVKARVLPTESDRQEMRLARLDKAIKQKEEELALRKKLKRLEELEGELSGL